MKLVRTLLTSLLILGCLAAPVETPKPVDPAFFGHMVQGEWVLDNGTLARPVTVYFSVLRLWDSRAVWWKMVNDTTALSANQLYAQSIGADVMFVFGEAPADALVAGKSKMPTMSAWLSFVSQISQSHVRYAEVFNEPAEGYWDGSPEELAMYSKPAYKLLKAAGITVLSPSFTSWNTQYGRAFITRFLAAGGGQWCDIIAFHAYEANGTNMYQDIVDLKAVLRSYGINKPIWNTEYNILPSDPALRNPYMAQSLVIQASLGVHGGIWNPETAEAANDYTDSTMRRVADMLIGSTVFPCSHSGESWTCPSTRGRISWTTTQPFPVIQ